MSEWKLAINGPGGRFQVSVAGSSTLDQLQDIIAEKGNVPKSLQKLSSGFPPKDIAIEPQKTIQGAGIVNGDMIRVTKAEAAPAAAPAGSGAESAGGLVCGERQFVRKVIPADNSCLFNSVAYCVEGRRMDMGPELRELIASVVISDPENFSESVLSKSNAEYARWILDKDSWGGAIECRILSDHYKTEIVCVDCQSLRAYRFGEDMQYKQRILLMYDGIHYDVLAEAVGGEGLEEFYSTIFDADDSQALEMGKKVVEGFKATGQFTDVGKFAVKCLVCGEGLAGAKEVQAHAAATGHTNFAENR